MTIILPLSTLAFDGTTINPANLKTDVFASPANPALITSYGPFYTNNLVITGVPIGGGSAVPLVLFQDYQFSPVFQLETQNTGFYVYSYVLLTNYANWSTVSVTYQAVGGNSTDTALQTQITLAGAFDQTQLDNWLNFTGDLGFLNDLTGGLTNINTVYTLASKLDAIAIALRTPSTYLSFITNTFTPQLTIISNLVASFNSLSNTLSNSGFLSAGSVRIRLSAPIIIYVSTNGNDSTGNGLTLATAFKSAQAAWNLLNTNYDLNGQVATILLAAGTYAQGLVIKSLLVGQQSASQLIIGGAITGSATIAINSTGANSDNSVISINNFLIEYGATATLTNLTITNAYSVSGVLGNGISVQDNSRAVISTGVVFGTVSGNGISSQYNSHISITAAYTITSGCTAHWFLYSNSSISVTTGLTITITGTVAFVEFVSADFCSNVFCTGLTFTEVGAIITGYRYTVNHNSVINAGGVANYLPGNVNGTTPVNGGIYV